MAMGKTLTIYLAADLKKFNTGMSQAEGGLKGLTNSMKNMLGPAALGAAAAVGALATKMAIDGVKAAIEDEAAAAKLAQTLENLNLAHDTAPIEEYISSLEMAYGIADDQLRPAYDRLIRSTRDTAKANDTLSLALDVAAGTGKSLDSVVQALGRAYDGNTTGLSRLGTGLDSAILKTGDMTRITAALSDTFGGQAAAQADTFQGQLDRVSLAADNLKEAFGKGFLTAFANTGKATGDLVKDMKDLEVSAEVTGKLIGDVTQSMAKDAMELSKVLGFLSNPGATWNYIFEDIAIDLRGLSEAEKEAARSANEQAFAAKLSGSATEAAGDKVASAIPSWRDYDHSIRMTTDAFREYLAANSVRMNIVKEENKGYKDLAARQREVNTYTSITLDTTDRLTGSRSQASSAADKQSRAESRLTDAFDIQKTTVDRLTDSLNESVAQLDLSIKAVDDYAGSIQNNLLSALDLTAAWQGQFDEDGKKTGESWITAFDEQLNLAKSFGENLNKLKSAGVDQGLIEYLASLGAPTGNAIVTDMLAGDGGLIQTMNDKWVDVQETTKNLAMSLVPEFLTAGVESGIQTVDGLADQLAKETVRLGRIGKQIAKPVGARFKAEFLKDIAEAIAEVEAVQTAARAEKVAAALRRESVITEQAVAQALTNLVRNADQRNGQSIAPVLM